MRRADLQADSLAFMYAHQFVDQAVDESELSNPLVHDIQYPTKAPLSDKVIDRNEVAEKVVFCALADLVARRSLLLTIEPIEALLGSRALARLAQLCGYPRQRLMVRRDGSFPASPLNTALGELFDSLLVPGSDFISDQRLPVRRLLKLLFRRREQERDPYQDVLQWVGEDLIDEGYYIESTDVIAGVVPFREAHPDKEKMLAIADRVDEMRERLAAFERREPELYALLKQTVAETMKEISILFQRRTTL